jgi:DNA-binding transcriptional LysR family regulator
MKLTKRSVSPGDMMLFADVVRQGSFTAAARTNGISKQAVSERVSKLEATLGVRLLQRTTRSLRATEAGARYHLECVLIAQLVERANSTMQAEQSESTGTLTVSVPNLFGRANLIGLIKTYRTRYPKVRVDLRLADRLVNLMEDGVDVALRVSRMEDSTLSARLIGTANSYFVGNPKLLRSLGVASDLELIRSAPALAFRDGETWALPSGEKIKPNVVVTIDDLIALSAAAAEGIGIARLPSILCRPLIAEKKLRLLLDGAPATRLSVYAAYLSKKQLAPKIRSFVDLLVEMRASFTDAQ